MSINPLFYNYNLLTLLNGVEHTSFVTKNSLKHETVFIYLNKMSKVGGDIALIITLCFLYKAHT